MQMLDSRFFAVLGLTKERFVAFAEDCRRQGVGHATSVGPYRYHEDDPGIEVGALAPGHEKPPIGVMVGTTLFGDFARVHFRHREIEAFFRSDIGVGPVPVTLTSDDDGRLRLEVGKVEFQNGLTGLVRVFDFEPDTSPDNDRRPVPTDATFLDRTVTRLNAKLMNFYRIPRGPESEEWSLLTDVYAGFELWPGCWLHVHDGWGRSQFLVVDTDRFTVKVGHERIMYDGWCQIPLPDLDGTNMSWLRRLREHGPDQDLLSEPINQLITRKTSDEPLKVGTPVLFTWQRHVQDP